jgi:hypothetical protein
MESVALSAPGGDLSIWALFWQAGWVVKLVMLGLLGASIWSWAIIIDKWISYARMRASLDRFEQVFWSGQSLEELYRSLSERKTTGMGAIFVAAMREWKKSFEKGARSPLGLQMRIDKAMDLALTREVERLEGRLGFLASVGSAGPFIGLFDCRFQVDQPRGCRAGHCRSPACDGHRPHRRHPGGHRLQQAFLGRERDRLPYGRLRRRVFCHPLAPDR